MKGKEIERTCYQNEIEQLYQKEVLLHPFSEADFKERWLFYMSYHIGSTNHPKLNSRMQQQHWEEFEYLYYLRYRKYIRSGIEKHILKELPVLFICKLMVRQWFFYANNIHAKRQMKHSSFVTLYQIQKDMIFVKVL